MQQTPNLSLNKPDGTDVVDIADLNENMDIIDGKLGTTGHDHSGTAGNGPKITSAGLANGAATDTVIGNRTITDTLAAAAAADTPTNLFSKIGYMIKSITGKSNWYTLPAITLEAINTLFGISGHAHTGVAGQGPKISYSNLSSVPSTFTPSTHSHDDRYYTETEANTLLAAKAALVSPALAGIPTAPTAAVGTNTTQLATTAFVQAAAMIGFDAAHSFAENGYQKLSNGIILQWGLATNLAVSPASTVITFPIAFPNACFSITATRYWSIVPGMPQGNQNITTKSLTNFTLFTGDTILMSALWFAIGN